MVDLTLSKLMFVAAPVDPTEKPTRTFFYHVPKILVHSGKNARSYKRWPSYLSLQWREARSDSELLRAPTAKKDVRVARPGSFSALKEVRVDGPGRYSQRFSVCTSLLQ